MRLMIGFLLGCMGLCATAVWAETAASWQAPEVANLETELVMELTVEIGKAVSIGESDLGTRRYIPITGGEFQGRGIKGKVLPGGADWQLTRPDGVMEVDAHYAIETDDGAVIEVRNRGIVAMPYVRTVPRFHAPAGDYEWLNKRLFVGTIQLRQGGGAVIIRVFEVL